MALLSLLLWTGTGAADAPLRIGTSGDYPPFSVVDPGGARQGFDVELATRLALHLDRPLVFTPFRWPELERRARAGDFDVVASGVTIRPERALFGRFTRPYAVSEAVVLIRRRDQKRFSSLAALDRAGNRISVNRGGYLEGVARTTFAAAAVETVRENLELARPLAGGRAEALVTDSFEETALRASHPDLVRLASLSRDRKALFVPAPPDAAAQARALHAAADAWLLGAADEVEVLRRRLLGTEAGMNSAEARAEAIAALVDQRCGLAPFVASSKRTAGLPIEDRSREARVLESAARRAQAAGLSEARVQALFRALIEASKDIQRESAGAAATADLETLRGVLGELDERLVAELGAARDLGREGRAHLAAAIHSLRWPGLTDARREQILAALTAALPGDES